MEFNSTMEMSLEKIIEEFNFKIKTWNSKTDTG